MGNVWSMFQSSDTCTAQIDCSKPANGLADASSGAGVGALAAFSASASINIVLSMTVILFQCCSTGDRKNTAYHPLNHGKGPRRQHLDQRMRRNRQQERTRKTWIVEQIILNLSDQQLVTGLALAITTRWFVNCDRPISAYHYYLVCFLLSCSVITHLCSIVAVTAYFDFLSGSSKSTLSRLAVLILRCIGIAVSIILTGLILFERDRNRFPVAYPASVDDESRLLLRPAVCFFVSTDDLNAITKDIPRTFGNLSLQNWSHGLAQYVVFLIAIAVAIPVAVSQSIYHILCCRRPAPKLILSIRLLVIFIGAAILVTNLILAWKLRNWIKDAHWLTDANGAEDTWTFGQIITLGVTLFTPLTLCEAAAEKFDASKNLAQLQSHASKEDVFDAWDSGHSLGTI